METLRERLQREASKKAHELFEMVLQGKLVPKDIEDALMSISTETLKETVRVIEGERKQYVPADLVWEGDEEQEVGEWKYVPAQNPEKAMYCLNCHRFLPEEGCICGMIVIDTAITAIEGLATKTDKQD